MSNPEYVRIDDKKYKINTDFRVAIECNRIARDKTIEDLERALAVIYKLFGEDGLNCKEQGKLLELGLRYLKLNRETLEDNSKQEFELDFDKCKGLIKSSFKYDYQYDPYELEYLHWYDFYNDLENLSTSEFGTCCSLNRVISILNQDVSEIKDNKSRQAVIDAKKLLKQKYCIDEQPKITKEQENNAIEFYKALGIDLRKE